MSADWQKAKSIFISALELRSAERVRYLAEACAGEDSLRRQVEELLSSYQTDFLEPNEAYSNGTHPAQDEVLKSGDKIGRYDIIRLLGVGGMGKVYLARDESLDRLACVKIFSVHTAASRVHLERFVREAQSASALNHPHICTIYEIDREHAPPFIAMEYIEGKTLAEVIASGTLDSHRAVDIALQIADGLADAHGAGIVHRDIKPANIVINKRGDAKILDFGLAKRVTADLDEKTQEKLSISGTIMGTVSYMSPEQVKGETVDARSDIFSFGVLLYEMVTCRRPFDGNSTAETMAMILTAEPASIESWTAPKLQALIKRCLEKDRSARFQSMREVVSGLQTIASGNSGNPQLSDQQTLALPIPTDRLPATPTIDAHRSKSVFRRPAIFALLAVALIAALLGTSAWLYYSRSTAPPIDSIAVMPLLNQTGNPESEYLSDGITESLIGRLSQIPNLSVTARSSVFRFKGKDVSPKDVAKDLNVPAILTGRLSRRGSTVSLYIELVDAVTEKVMWNAEYNRPESNLTTIPGEIARDVAENLRKKLSGGDEQKITRNYTDNSAAYELYLKGRYYWDKRTEEAYKVSEDAYKQAIALDPNYALAFAGLADCYLFREIGLGRDVAMPKAKEYALKALELDESLAEAHTTLAFVNANYDLDFASGEKEFKRAIELKPNYAIAHQFYGALLVATSRMDQGLAEMRRAVQFEPYTITINWSLGMGLGLAHRFDESIVQLQKTLKLQPGHALSEANLTGMLIQTGRYEDAMALVQKNLAVPERRDAALSNLAIIYAKTGRAAEAQKTLRELLADNSKSQNNPYNIARVYTALDEKDKAIDWLNKAVERRAFGVWFMRVDPFFDPLHGNPRYEELMRRIGLVS